MSKNPLGRATGYGRPYDPDLLFAVPRSDARSRIGLGAELPFTGFDAWNAWELTWLDAHGLPVVATAEIIVAADSDSIVESKSLKLYLDSLAMTRFDNIDAVQQLIRADLSALSGSEVRVEIVAARLWPELRTGQLPGTCIDRPADDPAEEFSTGAVEPALLRTLDKPVDGAELQSHLLRSNCPVTGQPDAGSILIRYSGPQIDAAGLLRYIVSYRQHRGFHEACVENIFIDILNRCSPTQLTVYARYNRRGGIDINPFRSNFETQASNCRLWRQ